MNKLILIFVAFLIAFMAVPINGAQAIKCGIDLRDFRVEGNHIKGQVDSLGNSTYVNYTIFVNNKLVRNSTVWVGYQSTTSLGNYIYFTPGRYNISIYAQAYQCYSDERKDSEEFEHIVVPEITCSNPSGNVGETICNKEGYVLTCGEEGWERGSYDDYCYICGCQGEPSGDSCGVMVKDFQYDSMFREDEAGKISVLLKNVGSAKDAKATLFIDREEVESKEIILEGAEAWISFGLGLGEGVYEAMVKVQVSGGGCDYSSSQVATIKVLASGKEESEIKETSVEIAPNSLDAVLRKGSIIYVTMETPGEGEFLIEASGVPESWLVFDRSVSIKDTGKAFIYVIPQEGGNYWVDVSVSHGDEIFRKRVELFVSASSGGNTEEKGFWEGMWDSIQGVEDLLVSYYYITFLVLAIFVVLFVHLYRKYLEVDTL